MTHRQQLFISKHSVDFLWLLSGIQKPSRRGSLHTNWLEVHSVLERICSQLEAIGEMG